MNNWSSVEYKSQPCDILERCCWWELSGALVKYQRGVQLTYMKVSGWLTGPGAWRIPVSMRLQRRPSGNTELLHIDALLFCCRLRF